MPTYAYACTECEHRFDFVQSFSDDALTECPECGGRLRKLFNAVGVVFKGSGFYRTDSRSSGSSSAPAKAGGSSGSTSGASGASSDSSSGTPSSGSSGSGSSGSSGSSAKTGTSSTTTPSSGAPSTTG